jgi:hypothetical protein
MFNLRVLFLLCAVALDVTLFPDLMFLCVWRQITILVRLLRNIQCQLL